MYCLFSGNHKMEGGCMSPRTGRPKKDNAMKHDIKYRIDDETNQKLEKYCEKFNKTKTEVARFGLLEVLGKKK